MKEAQCSLCTKIILLVKIFVLKQLRCLFWGVDSFPVVRQLQNNSVISYWTNNDVVIVNWLNMMSVAIGVNKQKPLHTGFLWEFLHFQF